MKNSNESSASKGSETSGGLEFSDWSGMKEHPRMSYEQACRYNQELIAMFPPKADDEARRWAAKNEAEFVL